MPPCTCELQQSNKVPQRLFCFGFYQQNQSVMLTLGSFLSPNHVEFHRSRNEEYVSAVSDGMAYLPCPICLNSD